MYSIIVLVCSSTTTTLVVDTMAAPAPVSPLLHHPPCANHNQEGENLERDIFGDGSELSSEEDGMFSPPSRISIYLFSHRCPAAASKTATSSRRRRRLSLFGRVERCLRTGTPGQTKTSCQTPRRRRTSQGYQKAQAKTTAHRGGSQ